MSDLIKKLQAVRDAQSKIKARLDINRERIAVVDKELAEHGVTTGADLDALEKALQAKLETFDAELTKAEEAIKNHTERNVE